MPNVLDKLNKILIIEYYLSHEDERAAIAENAKEKMRNSIPLDEETCMKYINNGIEFNVDLEKDICAMIMNDNDECIMLEHLNKNGGIV
ncbi:MAG: glycosyltransferase [Clostridium sp.]|nr:glycosyltransferase [Clostridium sp.]MCM1207428.1 glycosyltransferase [Ruminococcus sp.]